jgi:hypothetical protein
VAKVPLLLSLGETTGLGSTGKSPEVAIRRYRETDGAALDLHYWDGVSGFQATPNWIVMAEVDAVNSPGLYFYVFDQDLVGLEHMYIAYYRHSVAPVGFATELHVITNDIYAPVAIAEPVVLGNTVMADLARIKDGGTGNFDSTKDSLYHLNLNLSRTLGLLHENSIVDNQTYDTNGNLLTARLRVFDSATNLALATPGGSEVAGLIFEYNIVSGYLGGFLNEFKIERVT